MVAGRFTLCQPQLEPTYDDESEETLYYVTSWDTWEEAKAAWGDDGLMPAGYRLVDNETGRRWDEGSRYEWEAAAT